MAPQVGGVAGDDHHVRRARWDLLLAARAKIDLSGLRAIDSPDLYVQVCAGGSQVGDLLELGQFHRRVARPPTLLATAGDGAAHSLLNLVAVTGLK